MHGRIVSVQVKPEDLGKAVGVYRDSVIPAAKEQKGFHDALLFTDSATGRAVSITIWETEEDLLAGQASGYYQEQIAKFAELMIRTPDQEGFELAYSSRV
ncbi:MAG: antibiotic biosynthesis monooxygenase [Chloroflexi bacterium]|nr:antibiotic biosynthesis monooxygenase [Chloroflexota bacterium]